MRREMELIRELMLKLEAYPLSYGRGVTFGDDDDELKIPGYTADQVAYHLDQMLAAGWIDNAGSRPLVGFSFRAFTPAGHDFIDSIRDPEVWTKTKTGASKVGSWSLGLIKDMATAYAKMKAKDLLGLDV